MAAKETAAEKKKREEQEAKQQEAAKEAAEQEASTEDDSTPQGDGLHPVGGEAPEADESNMLPDPRDVGLDDLREAADAAAEKGATYEEAKQVLIDSNLPATE